MPALDRLQQAALVTLTLTGALVAVGALKRVLALSGGPLEDANRLLGAVVGLAALATLALAARRGAALVVPALLALGGIGAAGALGVKGAALMDARALALLQVASTVVVVLSLVTVVVRARPPVGPRQRRVALGSFAALALVLVQLGLGVNARASVDAIARAQPALPRDQRFENVGFVELAHVQLGPFVMFALVALWLTTRERERARPSAHAITAALATCVVQVLLGIALLRAGLPPAVQVLHVLGALVTAGALAAAGVSAARAGRADPSSPSTRR